MLSYTLEENLQSMHPNLMSLIIMNVCLICILELKRSTHKIHMLKLGDMHNSQIEGMIIQLEEIDLPMLNAFIA